MSMLGARDNETRSYLEIVDALRQHGAAPKSDMKALWRRLVFNILISNTDDHLRNHGFLYDGPIGWRLSPAYDSQRGADGHQAAHSRHSNQRGR
jgi:serine/threonine-protein kinase HipA